MIQNLFPIQIWKSSFPGDIEAQKRLILPEIQEILDKTKFSNQNSMRNDGLCSYNVCRNLNEKIEMQEIYEFVYNEIKKYWEQLNYSKKGFEILENWVNKYPPNSYIDAHNHAPIALSASFYLQKPKNSGGISFEHPLSTLLKHQPFDFKQLETYGNWFHSTIDIEEGDLVIFPSFLTHKTEINYSMSDRYIIGFNIASKKL